MERVLAQRPEGAPPPTLSVPEGMMLLMVVLPAIVHDSIGWVGGGGLMGGWVGVCGGGGGPADERCTIHFWPQWRVGKTESV